MPNLAKVFLLLGSLNAMLAVIFGAFGSHGLKTKLTDIMMSVYQTGVQYHFYHALGLILIGMIAFHLPASAWLKWAGWLMFAGILLFSGSLYLLAITEIRWLGAITPFGGTAYIMAWALLTVAILKA